MYKGFWRGNLRGDPGVNGRIILKWVFRKWGGLIRAGSGQGHVAGICEFGNEPLDFINCGEFLD